MRNAANILSVFPVLLAFLLAASCSRTNVIPSDTFSRIIAEMYLADQFVDENPEYRAQADSTALYESIFRKYGCDRDRYEASVIYYLQKKNTLRKIHIQARDFLAVRKNELSELLRVSSALESAHLPALDSARSKTPDQLPAYPYLRALRWMTLPLEQPKRPFTDTLEADVPGNLRWWTLNARLASDSLYPALPAVLDRYLPVRTPGADTLAISPSTPEADTLAAKPFTPDTDTLAVTPSSIEADTLAASPSAPEADTLAADSSAPQPETAVSSTEPAE